ncbi:MAG TPA: hypothetical protein VGW38_05635 [Chloroflexota bacterium]|nr:hypothetical protein [Chloroflexota bacterium]
MKRATERKGSVMPGEERRTKVTEERSVDIEDLATVEASKDLDEIDLISFGTASELTLGSGGRNGEASYTRP